MTPFNQSRTFILREVNFATQRVNDHYSDVTIGTMASQITSLTIVYSTVYSGADQRKHQSSASLAFLRGIHRWPVNSPHKWPVTRKMFPFDDVVMIRKHFDYIPYSWSPNNQTIGRCEMRLASWNKQYFFKLTSRLDNLSISCEIYYPKVNATRPHWWLANIASCNGVVPSGNKPLPEPTVTQIYIAIWRDKATLS